LPFGKIFCFFSLLRLEFSLGKPPWALLSALYLDLFMLIINHLPYFMKALDLLHHLCLIYVEVLQSGAWVAVANIGCYFLEVNASIEKISDFTVPKIVGSMLNLEGFT
jgi:hypothetical protein